MNGARLIYLMGASGSGKDTLLRLLRAQLRADEPVIVAHRYITATAAPARTRCGSRKMNSRGASAGGFALRWSSHGLRYGIGVEMDAWLPAARRSSSTVRAHTCRRMRAIRR